MRKDLRTRALLRIGLPGLVLVMLITACPLIEPPQSTRPVIIPATTNVADPQTSAVLESYDPTTGELRFSATTPLLGKVEQGDVIVGEPSPAAPGGYLRKVESVNRDGEAVVLETTQANLTDAVTQGEVTAKGDFTADDLSHAASHLAGVTAGVREAGVQPQAGVGDGYRFHIGFDEVALDLGEGDVQIQVVVNGELYFNAGWSVDLGIEPCLELPPVCVDRFEAKVGVEERLKISIAGEARAKLSKEIKVATYYFKPLVFFIGPVPIVVVPSIEVFVGAEGEVSLSFSYGLTETADALVGARWTEDRGWEDITDFGIELADQDSFELEGTMNASAYTRALTSLKLYDATGLALGVKIGAEFDAMIPRDPAVIVRGTVEGYVAFVVGLPILGTLNEHAKLLFSEKIELSRSPNEPPVFSGVRSDTIPVDVDTLVVLGPRGGGFQGYFDVTDREGGEIAFIADSSLDGRIPLSYTFRTLGVRTVTITATDPHGSSASIGLKFDVKSPPPIITTSYSGQPFVGVPFSISASAFDPVDGQLFCSELDWDVQEPDLAVAGGGGCDGEVTFGAEGNRAVVVSATNAHGSTGTETLTFGVGPEPANKPPVITSFSIVAAEGPKSFPTGPTDPYGCPTGFFCEVPPGGFLYNGQVREVGDYVLPLTLRAAATDDRGAPLTITWTCTGGSGSATVTPNGDGTYSCSPYFPGSDIIVKVSVSDGVGTTPMERMFGMRRTVN